MSDMLMTGSEFIATVDATFARIPLLNSDGYPVARYAFTDTEDAAFFYGEGKANATYVIVDQKVGSLTLAPIVSDESGAVFGNALEAITVFNDDVKRI
jgi:hypothetical protein